MLEINQVYLGDCLDVMKEIDAGSVDMILCDLPYGTTQCKWDSIIPLDKLWEQYNRVIKLTGVVVLTASQPFTSVLVMSNLAAFKQGLIWKKNVASNFLNANRMHLLRHEDLVIFYKKQPAFNKQYSSGESYIQKRSGKDDTGECYGNISKRTDTINYGQRNPISVLDFDREVGLHPTQKPITLFEYLIKTYTQPNELILDNCAGSGTTAIACINTNRNYILIEKEPKYVEICKQRILEV